MIGTLEEFQRVREESQSQRAKGYRRVRDAATPEQLAEARRKAREYARANVDRKQQSRRWYESPRGRLMHMLTRTKIRAKKLGLECDIDQEWLTERLVAGICEATGVELRVPVQGDRTKNPWSPSVDRINPRLGYIKTNCRVVCTLFNFAKNCFSDEEVEYMARSYVEMRARA